VRPLSSVTLPRPPVTPLCSTSRSTAPANPGPVKKAGFFPKGVTGDIVAGGGA